MLAIAQAEGTTLLVVDLPALDPGPGTAAVTDIVGAASKRLMHVNVAWTSAPTATEAERNRYTGAGLQLAKNFQGLPWKVNGTTANRPQGPNGLLLFAGLDRKNSAVELHLAGIAIVQPSGPGPDPTGPKAVWFRLMKRLGRPKPVSGCTGLRQHRDRSGAPRARRKLQRCPMALRGLATPRPGMPGRSNAARLVQLGTGWVAVTESPRRWFTQRSFK